MTSTTEAVEQERPAPVAKDLNEFLASYGENSVRSHR